MFPASKITLPSHCIKSGPSKITGSAFTDIIRLAVLIHPLTSVPVTTYVLVTIGTKGTVSIILLFQTYVDAPAPVSVTLPPAQITADELVAVTIGRAFTVTIVIAVSIQPLASVPVTIYVAVAGGTKATVSVTLLFQT